MNIRVDLNTPIYDGTEVVFRSPVDCSQITGLIVYHKGDDGNTVSTEFALADAHGNNVGDIDHLFAENVVVKVILDLNTSMAFVQNADTNAYLEGRFQSIEDRLGSGGSGGGSGAVDAVRYNPQTLTEAQKAQARENIDAISNADAEKKFGVQHVTPNYGESSFNDYTTAGRYFIDDWMSDGPPSDYLGSGIWLDVLPMYANRPIALQKVHTSVGEIWHRVYDTDGYNTQEWQRVYDTASLAEELSKGKMELLETITIGEDFIATYERTGYKLDALTVLSVAPASDTTGKVKVRAGNSNFSIQMGTDFQTATQTSRTYCNRMRFCKTRGVWEHDHVYQVQGWGSSIYTNENYRQLLESDLPHITRFVIYNDPNNHLPIGTTISIYGVRANEN